MKVSVTEVSAEASANTRPDEVWVQVLANRRPPWAEIQNFLEREYPDLWATCKPDPAEHLEFAYDEGEQYEFVDCYFLERVI